MTDRPGASLTCAISADVLNLSRNIRFYKLSYNANLGQQNTNRPKVGSANAIGTNNISIHDAMFGGFYMVFNGHAYFATGVVVRNGCYPINQCYTSDIEAIICIAYAPASTMTSVNLRGKLCACGAYGGLKGAIWNCNVYADMYGCGGGTSGNLTKYFGNVYSCQIGFQDCADVVMSGNLGYDGAGNSRANTTDFHFQNSGLNLSLRNALCPDPPIFGNRNTLSSRGRVTCEHYGQVAGSQRSFDAYGDLVKVTADGSGSLPSQRAGGSPDVMQVTPQSNCGTAIPGGSILSYLEIFNVRVWATAGVAKTYRFYIQNNFGKTLTDAMLKLYGEYLDNNPAGTGHLAVTDTTGQSVLNQIGRASCRERV